MRYYFTSIRMIIIQNKDNNKHWWGHGEIEPLIPVGMKNGEATLENSFVASYEVKHVFTIQF